MLQFEPTYIGESLYKCSDCKTMVAGDDIEAHRYFHAKIDELIDWAQAVSKVIKGE